MRACTNARGDETEAPVGHINMVKMRERLERLTVHNCRLRAYKLINFLFFFLGSTHNSDLGDQLAATGSNGGTLPSWPAGSNGGTLLSPSTGSNGRTFLSRLQLPGGRRRWEFYEDSESARIR